MADISKISPDNGATEYNIKDATARADIATINGKIGANNGIASLDNTGHVPSSQLPSYVDDVIEGYYNELNGKFYEDSSYQTEITPESSKIYVALNNDKSYRWSGTAYVEITSSLALGETEGTAYEGSKGKANADAISAINGKIPNDASTGNKLLTTATGNESYEYKGTSSGIIKETVGWISKNLLKVPSSVVTTTINGITFTVNRNSAGEVTSVKVNGTATDNADFQLFREDIANGQYIIHGGIENVNIGVRVDGYEYETFKKNFADTTSADNRLFTYTAGSLSYEAVVYIRVKSGATVSNKMVYPMLVKGSVTDLTFEPYHDTVEQELAKKANTNAIPTSLSQLSGDSTHRVVTDAEKATWNSKVSESLLKDTVGWVGKNKLKIASSVVSSSTNGITFTVKRNALGELVEVDANGTASANTTFSLGHYIFPSGDYIFSGCPANGSSSSYRINISTLNGSSETGLGYDYGEGFNFTLSEDTDLFSYLRIASGAVLNHVKFYPMLRDASIADDTYEPYHESVEAEIEQVYADNGVLGAKNLLPFPYVESSKTENGLTFTVNSDGSIKVNGTASANTILSLDTKNTNVFGFLRKFAGKQIKICGGHSENKRIEIWATNISNPIYYSSMGEDTVVTIPSSLDTDSYNIRLRIQSGETCNNEVFYPQFILPNDIDTTYQPYAMTNRELTDRITGIYREFTTESLSNIFNIVKENKCVLINTSGDATAKLSNNALRSVSTGYMVYNSINNLVEYAVTIMSSGELYAGEFNSTNVTNIKKIALTPVI